ncbi:hypothetical protein DFH06DRAFT_437322 [Mycena polygramma]|nr:hypothetical protein DFH06DRAFT_437322 [Mycena polygramma]
MAAVYRYYRALELRHNFLKAHLDTYAYPVLTLPNEIISEIFLHTVEPTRAGGVPSSTDGPLLVAQICRRWRDIALSTPRLWSNISLDLENIPAYEGQLHLLETWLRRSGDCPLFISIIHQPRPLPSELWGKYDGSVREFVRAILPHRRRWQELEISVPMHLFKFIEGEMPLLRDLTLGIPDMTMVTAYGERLDPGEESRWPIRIFHEAPALRTLLLAKGFDPLVLLPPWGQLTSVSILHFTQALKDVADILRSAVNVQYFSARVHDPYNPETSPLDILPIPPLEFLEALHLTSLTPESEGYLRILDALSLPALVVLRISETWTMDVARRAVQDLIARSCPVLKIIIQADRSIYPTHYYRSVWPSVISIEVQRTPPVDIDGSAVASDSEDDQTDDEDSDESDGSEEE